MKEYNLTVNINYYISRILLSPIFPLIASLFWFIIFKSFDSSILLCDDGDVEVLSAAQARTYTEAEKQTILKLEQKLNDQIDEYDRYFANYTAHSNELIKERLQNSETRAPQFEQWLGYKCSLDNINMRHTMDEIRKLEGSLKELIPGFKLPIEKIWFENTSFTTENILFTKDTAIEKLNKFMMK